MNIEQIAESKKKFRSRLARLPINEKVALIVSMQRRNAPILSARGVRVHVWQIPTPSAADIIRRLSKPQQTKTSD